MTCEEQGCHRRAMDCVDTRPLLGDGTDGPARLYRYCRRHAIAHGFCVVCGRLVARERIECPHCHQDATEGRAA